MFYNNKMNEKVELVDIDPYRDEDRWLFKLTYTANRTDGKYKIVIPACVCPILEDCLTINHDPYSRNTYLGSIHTPPAILYSNVEGLPSPVKYVEELIEPRVKEMTLEQIEKELGYRIKIVNKKES